MKRIPREAWWLVGIILAMLGVTVALEGGNPEVATDSLMPSRTTYSNREGGLRALYLTLEKLDYRVSRWRRPFLEGLLPAGTLVVVEPTASLAGSEWSTLHRWVAQGNTLVFCAEYSRLGGEFSGGPGAALAEEPPMRYAAPSQPTYLARQVARLRLKSRARLALPALVEERGEKRGGEQESAFPEGTQEWRRTLAESAPVFRDEEGVAVTYARLGRGNVIVLCSPWTLSNEGLAHADNLPFVLNGVGAPSRGPVFFDEYHHGYGENLAWALLPTPVRWGLAELLLAGCVLVYARSRRFGRIIPLLRASRERSEFLGTMTAVLRQGEASRLAVRTAYQAAMHRLHKQLGLPETAEVEVLGQAARRADPKGGARLQTALERCRAAVGGAARPSEAAAVGLVRALDEAERELAWTGSRSGTEEGKSGPAGGGPGTERK